MSFYFFIQYETHHLPLKPLFVELKYILCKLNCLVVEDWSKITYNNQEILALGAN